MAATPISFSSPEAVTTNVTAAADVSRVSAAARKLADALGFSRAESDEIALVASELGSNLIRHAGGGFLSLVPLDEAQHKGLQLESLDSGPGIHDVELALTDGFSTAGGLGNGLGTVNRLMDQLEFNPRPKAGVQIVCRRWIRPPARKQVLAPLDCGAATRPSRFAVENGDAFVIRQWDDLALVGLIDGLGHGRFAHKAAKSARTYLEHHFDQPLRDLFRGVGRACRATRGVVMSLARFELAQGSVEVAGIGNVEVRLLGTAGPSRPTIRRGVLGGHAPEPLIKRYAWDRSTLLILHSDGLRSRWDWQDYPQLSAAASALIARELLQDLAKPEDDATIVVVRNAFA